MKNIYITFLALTALLITAPYAYADVPVGLALADISGRWLIEREGYKTEMTLNKDGTFEIDLDGDSRRDMWGTFVQTQYELKFIDKNGKGDCKKPGRMLYYPINGKLKLEMLFDTCPERILNLFFTWHKK